MDPKNNGLPMDNQVLTTVSQLQADLEWLREIIYTRLNLHFGLESSYASIFDVPLPKVEEAVSMYGSFLEHYAMDIPERVTFLLALAPHLQPDLLDVFFQPNPELHRGYTEFGGVKGQLHNGFLPSGETALFLLAGIDLQQRLEFEYLFDQNHYFARHQILQLEQISVHEPRFSAPLIIKSEVIDLITTGRIRKPVFSRDFPAHLLTTGMEWEDLVLSGQTRDQLKEIQAWIEYEKVLMDDWGMAKKIKPGYKCLFYGPPGTGKTLTATILGKYHRKDVYRIDLSTVVSKYIGETEKNLERIFQQTSFADCILFFDEADALFGKRTNVNEAHDRYANQEVSYLLQRIEDYEGLVILASNFKTNIDEAFLRRFQSVVYFPMPDINERYRLWLQAFSSKSKLEQQIDLWEISGKYQMTGGAIINVVRYASLMALQRHSEVILLADLIAGIHREFQKEGEIL